MSEHGHTHNEIDELMSDLTDSERQELATADAAIELAFLFHDAREARKLTQAEAARRAGVRQQAVSRFEQPDIKLANTKFETLRKYLTALGYTVGLSIKDAASGALVKETHFEPSQIVSVPPVQAALFRPKAYGLSGGWVEGFKASGPALGMMATTKEDVNALGRGSFEGALGHSTFEVNNYWNAYQASPVYDNPRHVGVAIVGAPTGRGVSGATMQAPRYGSVKQEAVA